LTEIENRPLPIAILKLRIEKEADVGRGRFDSPLTLAVQETVDD
jgi:hypothetical protein